MRTPAHVGFAGLAGLLVHLAAAQEGAGSAAAEIGKAAPDFTLRDTDGKDVSRSSFKGKIVILRWINPGCPYTGTRREGDVDGEEGATIITRPPHPYSPVAQW